MARSGLKKVVKSVRGKKGSVKRSYWVRASGAVKGAGKAARGFAGRHSGKLKVAAGVLALAGAAYGAHKIAGGIQHVQKVRTGRAQAGRTEPMSARDTATHFATGFRRGSDVGKRVQAEATHQRAKTSDPTYDPSLGRKEASSPIRGAARAYNAVSSAYGKTQGARSAVSSASSRVRGAVGTAATSMGGVARRAGSAVRSRVSRKGKASPFRTMPLGLSAG
jgi:hypothetical protein